METKKLSSSSIAAKAATIVVVLAALLGFDGAIRSIVDPFSEPTVRVSSTVRFIGAYAPESTQISSEHGTCALISRRLAPAEAAESPPDPTMDCIYRGAFEAIGSEGLFVTTIASIGATEVGDRSISRVEVVRGTSIPVRWLTRFLAVVVAAALCFMTPRGLAAAHTIAATNYARFGTAIAALAPAAIALLLTAVIGISAPSFSTFSGDRIVDAILLAPFIEEMLFRAWGQSTLEKYFGSVVALLLTATVFSLAHGFDGINTAIAFMNGFAFGLLWIRTRSVLMCVLSHSAFNAVLGILGSS